METIKRIPQNYRRVYEEDINPGKHIARKYRSELVEIEGWLEIEGWEVLDVYKDCYREPAPSFQRWEFVIVYFKGGSVVPETMVLLRNG